MQQSTLQSINKYLDQFLPCQQTYSRFHQGGNFNLKNEHYTKK